MAGFDPRFFDADSINDLIVKLRNNGYLRARNAADNGMSLGVLFGF